MATDTTEPDEATEASATDESSFEQPGLGEASAGQQVDQDRELADRLLLATDAPDGVTEDEDDEDDGPAIGGV